MSVLVPLRAEVGGVERDLFVEVRLMDVLVNSDRSVVVVLDEFSVLAAPGADPERLPSEEVDELGSLAEVVIEETAA
ncbi:MAG: hypothetical protein OXC28_07340 [Defluviicoccus sp.]|nr:hypothetical protein [Defluviicoccus sp.]